MSFGFSLPHRGGPDLPKSFDEARALFEAKSKRSNWTGRIANNTYLRSLGWGDREVYAIQLHSTDVVTYHADGRVVLSTGGWQTLTTRERIRRCGFPIYTSNGVASVSHRGRSWTFADGMVLLPDGAVEYPRTVDPDPARVERRRKAAGRKARRTGDYSDFTHCDTRGSLRWHGGNVPEAFIAPPASSPALEVA